MTASYINIEGGANFKLDITKNDLRVQNPEFRLVCKTKDGAINIELPIINEAFESNYNAKIFIDDADDMADVNNITVSLATKIVSAQKKISSMIDILGKVGVSVIGNFVAQLTPSIGGNMILSGFGEKSKNDGTHIIDSVELFTDEKGDAFTRIFSSTLTFEESISEIATITADATIYPNTIENDTQYIVSQKGGKLEIFISSGKEYGVLKNGTLVGASKKFIGLLNGFGGDMKLGTLKSELGDLVVKKDSAGVFKIQSDKNGTFVKDKTVYPNPQIVGTYIIEAQRRINIAKFTYIDDKNILMETFDGTSGLNNDVQFTDFPLHLEVYA